MITDAIDDIYGIIDDALLDENFEDVDRILKDETETLQNPEWSMNLDVCLTILTASHAAKDILKNYQEYFDAVEQRLMDEDIEPEEILFGLD